MAHSLTNEQWREFFVTCTQHLSPGGFRYDPSPAASWCAFTTFDRLGLDAGYWTRCLPRREDIADSYIEDGGAWGQPFPFDDLAHLIIPRTFYWENIEGGRWIGNGRETQDIERLSAALVAKGIEHRLSHLVLEIKRY